MPHSVNLTNALRAQNPTQVIPPGGVWYQGNPGGGRTYGPDIEPDGVTLKFTTEGVFGDYWYEYCDPCCVDNGLLPTACTDVDGNACNSVHAGPVYFTINNKVKPFNLQPDPCVICFDESNLAIWNSPFTYNIHKVNGITTPVGSTSYNWYHNIRDKTTGAFDIITSGTGSVTGTNVVNVSIPNTHFNTIPKSTLINSTLAVGTTEMNVSTAGCVTEQSNNVGLYWYTAGKQDESEGLTYSQVPNVPALAYASKNNLGGPVAINWGTLNGIMEIKFTNNIIRTYTNGIMTVPANFAGTPSLNQPGGMNLNIPGSSWTFAGLDPTHNTGTSTVTVSPTVTTLLYTSDYCGEEQTATRYGTFEGDYEIKYNKGVLNQCGSLNPTTYSLKKFTHKLPILQNKFYNESDANFNLHALVLPGSPVGAGPIANLAYIKNTIFAGKGIVWANIGWIICIPISTLVLRSSTITSGITNIDVKSLWLRNSSNAYVNIPNSLYSTGPVKITTASNLVFGEIFGTNITLNSTNAEPATQIRCIYAAIPSTYISSSFSDGKIGGWKSDTRMSAFWDGSEKIIPYGIYDIDNVSPYVINANQTYT